MTNLTLSALSAVFVLTGILAIRRTAPSQIHVVVVLLLAALSILLLVANGVASYFTGNGINEATIYHLKYGLEGAGFLEYRWLIGAALVTLLVTAYLLIRLAQRTKSGRTVDRKHLSPVLPIVLLIVSLLLNPAIADLYKISANSLIEGNISDDGVTHSLYEFYRKPAIASTGDAHKNLVFIYAESLERTYFDQTIFPGLTNGLRELESRSTYFTDIRQVTGTGWTIAGMTASLCGIPLFTPSHGNSMSGMDQFLSSAVCLGDLLREQGYELNYMGGASTEFAGKGKLFESHGFSKVLGQDDLLPRLDDPSYKNAWGLFDDSLFDMTYRRFVELSESADRFGLFMLTLDTHHPGGHPSASCAGTEYGDGSNAMLNAVACSDFLISKFVQQVADSPHANETIVVIVSDHLAMRNTAYRLLTQTDRTNLFMIIEPGQDFLGQVHTAGSTLDIGPTLLPFLGFSGEIGLGRNLASHQEDEDERIQIHTNLGSWSKPIAEFWGFPRLRKSLAVDIDKQLVTIDNRVMRMPILIELDSGLQSILRFQFDGNRKHKSLIDHRNELANDSYFLLIDECRNVAELDGSLGQEGFCIVAGRGDAQRESAALQANITYSANDVRELLGLSNGFEVHRVAHAGGGIDGKTYTNSFEALNHNLAKGFRYFEIDFSFTSDSQLVCLHDWDDSFTGTFGYAADSAVTLAEFEELVANKSTFHKCTADSLAAWMRENPSAYLITDMKERNVEALGMMLRTFPDASSRIIPQIYDPENLAAVKELGFENVIWTLYRFRRSNDEILKRLEDFGENIAVTMPKGRADTDLPIRLRERTIPTYVHTVNSLQDEEQFINNQGVTELYTDFLEP